MAKKAQAKNLKSTKTAKPAKAAAVFPSTGYWLMKSEPEAYSIDLFAREKKTLWTGVRNYQARNFMMTSMKRGDQFLFYHSNAEPTGVVGVGEITGTNLPDPSAQDSKSEYYDPKSSPDHPIWFCAEVSFRSRLKNIVTLTEIRTKTELADMALLRKGQRLSIQPVTKKEFDLIVKMGGGCP